MLNLPLSEEQARLLLNLCDMHAECLVSEDPSAIVAAELSYEIGRLLATIPTPKADKFVVGETYTCRSACDHATIFAWKVVARTDKTLTLEQYGKTEKRGVRIGDDGIERCRPSGRYSMAPVISADRRGEC
jgi:hypothetical protein